MKKDFVYFVLMFSLLLFSCKTEKKETIVESLPAQLSQLVNWSSLNEKGWDNISFPDWFVPKWIDSFNIEKIKLEFTSFNFTDTNLQVTDTLPYQLITIDFKKNGTTNKMIIQEYSSGIEIAKNIFTYNTPPDAYGYSSPNVSSNIKYGEKNMLSFINTMQELQQYQRLELEEKDSTLLKYIDKNSSKRVHHYFILDSANWNVSYIDEHFDPQGKDVFYFGSPQDFVASFTLKNLVEKTKKEEQYFYSTGTLKSQYFHYDGFITKRHYKYDSLGLCVGFLDSLVTKGGEFLHLEKGKIKYKSKKPQSVGIFNSEDSLMVDPIRRVRFSYTYGEK